MLNEAEVLSAIKSGSIQEHLNKNVELKESWHLDHGQKISAIANKYAIPVTWFIVGLKDNGTLAGKTSDWAKKNEEIISQHINDKLDPIQACHGIFAREINGSYVLILKIVNPGDVVYWGSNAYCASGTTQRIMEPEEVLELRLKLPGLTDFSRQVVESGYNNDLILLLLNRINKKGSLLECATDVNKFMQTIGLARTQAARILFGHCPFRIVEFNAADEPVHQRTEYGLYKLLTDDFHEYIQKQTSSFAGKDFKPYPELSLKESLANAVAHAAYFEQNGDIILELRPTTLTISNLCLRESQYFANRWFSRAHKTINAYLMEVLRIAGHVDELGRGKNVIFAESIKHGKRPPQVYMQKAGKYFRWTLILQGDVSDPRQLRVLSRINEIYRDPQKALIAHALVLWSDKAVSEIKNYIDDSFSDAFADVLSSFEGPIFYYKEEDRIVLKRWVRVLLEEGKDSKQLTFAEEMQLLSFAKQLCVKYEGGHITPARLRELGDFSDSSSARTLSSQLLAKWEKDGHVTKLAQGKYKFIEIKPLIAEDLKETIRQILTSNKGGESDKQLEQGTLFNGTPDSDTNKKP